MIYTNNYIAYHKYIVSICVENWKSPKISSLDTKQILASSLHRQNKIEPKFVSLTDLHIDQKLLYYILRNISNLRDKDHGLLVESHLFCYNYLNIFMFPCRQASLVYLFRISNPLTSSTILIFHSPFHRLDALLTNLLISQHWSHTVPWLIVNAKALSHLKNLKSHVIYQSPFLFYLVILSLQWLWSVFRCLVMSCLALTLVPDDINCFSIFSSLILKADDHLIFLRIQLNSFMTPQTGNSMYGFIIYGESITTPF